MRKSLNFDLDTKKLKEHYLNNSYTEAYNDIKKFLIKNGFEHRQGSGYISENDMSSQEVADIIKALSNKYSWLKHCFKTFDSYDIGDRFDLANIIVKQNIKENEVTKKEIQKEKKQTYKISNYEPKNKNRTKDKDIER